MNTEHPREVEPFLDFNFQQQLTVVTMQAVADQLQVGDKFQSIAIRSRARWFIPLRLERLL